MKTYGGGTDAPFWISALDGGELSAYTHFNPGNHWIGGWVGPRAGLEAVKRKSCPCQESNPGH
jgi:ribosome modulation factor